MSVPAGEAQQVTRYRKRLVQLRTSEVQRVEKTLEDAVVELGSVASSTLGVSGRQMIEALIAGERDPQALAELAKAKLRNSILELTEALDSRFEDHHAVRLRQLLDHIDWFDATIDTLNQRSVAMTEPWSEVIERLQTIPGVGQRTAEVLIAETGADMSRFPDHRHLATWAGLCPGHNESGGKRRSGRTRHGDVWLAEALTEAARAAIRTKDTYLQAKFWRVAGPRADGHAKSKAAIAVAHKILIAACHIMATPGVVYHEVGGDYFANHDNPERRRDRLVAHLTKLGYDVDPTPAEAA